MKFLILIIPLLFLMLNAKAQQENVVIPDYGASIQFQAKTLEKLGTSKVEDNLRKEFQHLYSGFIRQNNMYVLRITAVMQSSEELRSRLTKLYPGQTVKQITSKEYEFYEKQFQQ